MLSKRKVLKIIIEIFIILAVDSYILRQTGHNLILRIVLGLFFAFTIMVCGRYYKDLKVIPAGLIREKRMYYDLTINDFQAKFAGSFLGTVWAFIQPIITVVLYWFVFQVGLRASNVSSYPFVLYLMSGMIPWFYFSDAWGSGTNVLQEYSYLVKKVIFDVEMLPTIKVSSALFTHIFFMAFLIVLCTVYGYKPSLFMLQLPYYLFCVVFFVLGITYITSACAVFFKDMIQVVNIALTIGIWVAPVMWNPVNTLSPGLVNVFRLNPIYYIVDGYRDALLNKEWFWQEPLWTVYFWCIALLTYTFGVKLFLRLKPHFSDVL